ncbi:hypothetical protein NGRA_3120 [Nosema granulosis]|uniref:Uncharacterized protein n=1 Tax=Nosema granulosis TaxID=83296 RepID=A0A9P6GY07_9MICR|nr:hypothetical protein NGRA_3120 [Nosema granulosis]
MFYAVGMAKATNIKNVFFDSDDEKPIKKNPETKKPTEEPWKLAVTKYTILSKFQIEQLEMEFIKRRLKFSKNNIKAVSKDLKIPFKRAYNYFNNKLKATDNKILKRTQEGIKELEKINLKLEKVWVSYLETWNQSEDKLYGNDVSSQIINNKLD